MIDNPDKSPFSSVMCGMVSVAGLNSNRAGRPSSKNRTAFGIQRNLPVIPFRDPNRNDFVDLVDQPLPLVDQEAVSAPATSAAVIRTFSARVSSSSVFNRSTMPPDAAVGPVAKLAEPLGGA
ncbi:hypothetical protein ACFOHS_18085 [Jhaorihella thermophila]